MSCSNVKFLALPYSFQQQKMTIKKKRINHHPIQHFTFLHRFSWNLCYQLHAGAVCEM